MNTENLIRLNEQPRLVSRIGSDYSDISMTAVGTIDEGVEDEEEKVDVGRSTTEGREWNGFNGKMSLLHHRESVASGGISTQQLAVYEGIAKAKGLNLDLEEPWQRSLLRELEKLDLEGEAERQNIPKPELMLLRHSESRDYAFAIEHDDDATVGTNASSPRPTKSQLIHRSGRNYYGGAENSTNLNSCLPRLPCPPVASGSRIVIEDDRRDEFPNGENTSKKNYRSRDDPTERSNVSRKVINDPPMPSVQESARCIPFQLTQQPIHRASAINDEMCGQPFLEVELSDEADASMSAQESCFCWGYNVLDFWLPPPKPSYRRKRVSRSSSNNMGGPVEVNKEPMHPKKKEKSQSVETNRSTRTDPAGSYMQHNYNTSDCREMHA